MTYTHLLLDIEGTTCPVSFVADVLFPYARQRLRPHLETHGQDPEVAALVTDALQLWLSDTTPATQQLLESSGAFQPADTAAARAAQVVPYLEWLIDHDVKATPLKDLQGRIWREGYASEAIQATLFSDVPDALKRWHQQGLVLAVYSSGSVAAQQLLYGHCQNGDLTALFSHWFDTRSGAKQEAESYRTITTAMDTNPAAVLFISDSLPELEAAASAGLAVLFSDREGNPGRDSGHFARISDYSQLSFDVAHGSGSRNPADQPGHA
ncbi:MAG: acireductone synthase [Vulcanococcus sp.]